MYELVQVGANSYYLQCPAKIGIVIAKENNVYLIDSGNDKDAGRRVRQVLEQQGWILRGILNTHSHADHIGGNHYLQAQTGCKIFASGIEAAFIRHPVLEPTCLYGGYPADDLRHKFLMAQESDVCDLSDPDFPKEIEVIPLPGHSLDMVGFRTPDNTVFLADCISSRETLEKYAVSYLYDAAAFLHTLDAVEAMQADMFVPSHAEAEPDMRALIQYNRKKVLEIAALLTDICQTPQSFDQILQQVFAHFRLTMTVQQQALVGSTVRSYLSWLKGTGVLTTEITENLLCWKQQH